MPKPQPKKPAAKPQQPKGAPAQPPAGTSLITTADDASMMQLLPAGDAQLPAHIKKGDKRGTENLGISDLVIPRLEIVQGLSPAMKRGDPGFINGAQQGMMNNSVTRELYGDVVQVIPIEYMVQYLVWRDRKMAELKKLPTEGGFFGAYPTMEEAQARADQEGGEGSAIVVVDTPTHFCLLLNRTRGALEEIMVSMPKTKAKISRQWNTLVKMTGVPRFGRAYEVRTVLQKNPKGDFYNYSITALGFPPKALYEKAEALYESVKTGGRTLAMDTRHMEPGDTTDAAADDGNSKM